MFGDSPNSRRFDGRGLDTGSQHASQDAAARRSAPNTADACSSLNELFVTDDELWLNGTKISPDDGQANSPPSVPLQMQSYRRNAKIFQRGLYSHYYSRYPTSGVSFHVTSSADVKLVFIAREDHQWDTEQLFCQDYCITQECPTLSYLKE
jgi:hypothetical protein